MSYFSSICFICLNVIKDSNLNRDVENRAQLKYVLPEIINFDSKTRICSSCRQSLHSVYMFKKKCLRNYCRLKHDADQIMTSAKELEIKLNREKNIEEPLQTSEEEEEEEKDDDEEEETQNISVSKEIESESNICNQLIKESDIPFITTEDVTDTVLEVQDVKVEIMSDYIKPSEIKSKHASKDSSLFCCANCDFKTQRKYTLAKHILSLHPVEGEVIKCSTCNRVFSKHCFLVRHLESNTCHLSMFKCPICNKVFTNQNNVKRHMQIHAGIKEFKCTVCKKEFLQKSHFERHVKIHEGIKDYKCLVCEKSFLDLCSLRNHISVHKDSKDLVCNLCSKIFSCADSLIKHKESEHNMKNYFGNFKCTKCNKRFSSLHAFKIHAKHHNKIEKYKCHMCDKRFHRSNLLLIHTKSHLGIKKFECSVCFKAYADKRTFTIHVRRHEQADKEK